MKVTWCFDAQSASTVISGREGEEEEEEGGGGGGGAVSYTHLTLPTSSEV